MASRSVNKVILLGHLGKDAETRFTPSGAAVTNFTLATNRRWKDQQTGEWKEQTDWHNIVAWRVENLSQYLTKGKQVYVEGRLQTRSYDDKDGNKRYTTEVVADDVILLSGRGGEGGGSDMGEGSGSYSSGGSGGYGGGSSYGNQGGGGPVSMPRSARPQRPSSSSMPEPAGDPYGNQGVSDDDVPF